ncbi:MAG TPA: hypothetical protein VGQ89_08325 [Candidatus Limnocylindrales bacterium]|nr:hypothetical protein [Candidatus Limnocylindrales bacterium]
MRHGPLVWENWKAEERGEPSREAWEFAFYTDAHPIGEVTTGLGPYQLLLGLTGGKDDASDPAIVLRMENHLQPTEPTLVWQPTAVHREVAALVSLALGIRCRSGGETRWFRPTEDPRGRPALFGHRRPQLSEVPEHEGRILPNVVRQAPLTEAVELISILPSLHVKQAEAVVRAARAYEEAVWVAEGDPAYAWLKFVSAAEAAASAWRGGAAPAGELLAQYEPELAEHLRAAGGGALVTEVAALLGGRYRAAKKFVRFLLTFGPPPPEVRPPEPFQLEWPLLGSHPKAIYGVRSDSLHHAAPVPQPMLNVPLQLASGPIEVWPSPGGTRWVMLHTFERITGVALRSWWRSLAT